MAEEHRKKTDLVLSVGEYAFTQDATTGAVKVLTGPTVVNVTGQEYPVVYEEPVQRFRAVDLADAAQKSPMAPQGFYIELHNPADSGAQPTPASKENAPTLMTGRRVNIPGPITFALWPSQIARVIEGHHLRSNQYLLCRIYDVDAARENWKKAVLETASGAASADESDGPQGTISELTEDDLSVGRLFVIKGTEVSFYIPPTGVEVVADEDGKFVRDALTLERLQYCILVDETGDKDYQRGPKVVFPKPTQRFYRDPKSGATLFRPTELNPKQGIHVKVIAPYREDGIDHAEGEELFITGAETSIYFPRPEHSLIRYDGNAKHFATAVPAGEARYVMNRGTGEIRMVRGPTMLLPDPRSEIIVRRVLTEEECALWYPGNSEVSEVNGILRELLGRSPSTRAAVSEGEVKRSKKARRRPADLGIADMSSVHSAASGAMADEWVRAASYAEPRTLTLTTKYAGVPAIRVWPGYAVMVVRKQGDRRVVVGPATVLLEHDESLEVFELSTNVPKSTERPKRTVYLKLRDNLVRDLVVVETKDRVFVTIKLTLRVGFEGDPSERWFSERDYVKRVTAHVRRLVKAKAQNVTIEAFHADPARIVREAVLGSEARLAFEDAGLVVDDVELVSARINDGTIAKMFEDAQQLTVASAVELKHAEEKLAFEKAQQVLEREKATEVAETQAFQATLELQRIQRELELVRARHDAVLSELTKKTEQQRAADALANETTEQALARRAKESEQRRLDSEAAQTLEAAAIRAQTEAAVARFKAAEGPLAEAIQLLGNQDVLAKVAEAVSAQRLFGGKDVADVVGSLFEGTGLQGLFAEIERKASK
ncbi:MAG: hypothetical protein AAGE52_40405 [Myxococcota bacterium]